MNPAANNQRLVAAVLFFAGITAIVAGVALGALVDPWLYLISVAGISDIGMSRYFLSQGERATPAGTGQPVDRSS